jgi:hypothetical protein
VTYRDHLQSVQDAWSAINAAVTSLTNAVDALERARGPALVQLHTAVRMREIRVRVDALIKWEQERAVVRSDRRFTRRDGEASANRFKVAS